MSDQELNAKKASKWAFTAIKVGALGSLAGGIIGVLAAQPDARPEEIIAMSMFGGAWMSAAIPAACAAWFLLLHMIGQVAQSVRGPSNRL